MGDYHVVLYTSPQCEDCRDAKAFLEGKGIQYEEKSIQDPGVRGELAQKTGKADCPTIDVDGHVVVGFLENKWGHLVPESPLRKD